MSSADSVRSALEPLLVTVASLDLADPPRAQAILDRAHPYRSLGAIADLCREAQAEGWLTPKRASADLTFGRLAKPEPTTHQLSVDVVDMGGAGAEHVHPRGEVSLCFEQSGEPLFCGHPPGWVVLPPGSRHVPTVTGGRMLIVYFLPEGAMEWVR
jgi:hypothetical protein